MKKAQMTIYLAVMCVMAVVNVAAAELIRGINMDFVTIGNAGNAGDTRTDYPYNANPYGCGAVSYNYRIGKYEITNAQWDAFTAAAGVPTGNPSSAYDESAYFTGAQQPANMVSWYEAAQFCNYLTSGNKSLGAYLLGTDGSITVDRATAISTYGTAYVIPTGDEWYKAAYFKPDGSGYSRYANGLDTASSVDNDSWNYHGVLYRVAPWKVGRGEQEQNGTFDMMGNVWEWNETLIDDISREIRGGAYNSHISDLSASNRRGSVLYNENYEIGFRVASVPEPATLMLLGFGMLALRTRKKI